MNLRELFGGGFKKIGFSKDSEKQVFRVLFETYYEKVYKTIFMMTGDREISQDLTQETFIRAIANIGQLKDPGKFGAWLSAIATNQARDCLRKKNKIIPVEDITYYQTLDKLVWQANILLPEQVIENNELSKKVIEAIDELDDIHKQVIILKYYWELSEKEMAEVLNIKAGTVKSRLYRAKAQIKIKLKEYILESEGEQFDEAYNKLR